MCYIWDHFFTLKRATAERRINEDEDDFSELHVVCFQVAEEEEEDEKESSNCAERFVKVRKRRDISDSILNLKFHSYC